MLAGLFASSRIDQPDQGVSFLQDILDEEKAAVSELQALQAELQGIQPPGPLNALEVHSVESVDSDNESGSSTAMSRQRSYSMESLQAKSDKWAARQLRTRIIELETKLQAVHQKLVAKEVEFEGALAGINLSDSRADGLIRDLSRVTNRLTNQISDVVREKDVAAARAALAEEELCEVKGRMLQLRTDLGQMEIGRDLAEAKLSAIEDSIRSPSQSYVQLAPQPALEKPAPEAAPQPALENPASEASPQPALEELSMSSVVMPNLSSPRISSEPLQESEPPRLRSIPQVMATLRELKTPKSSLTSESANPADAPQDVRKAPPRVTSPWLSSLGCKNDSLALASPRQLAQRAAAGPGWASTVSQSPHRDIFASLAQPPAPPAMPVLREASPSQPPVLSSTTSTAPTPPLATVLRSTSVDNQAFKALVAETSQSSSQAVQQQASTSSTRAPSGWQAVRQAVRMGTTAVGTRSPVRDDSTLSACREIHFLPGHRFGSPPRVSTVSLSNSDSKATLPRSSLPRRSTIRAPQTQVSGQLRRISLGTSRSAVLSGTVVQAPRATLGSSSSAMHVCSAAHSPPVPVVEAIKASPSSPRLADRCRLLTPTSPQSQDISRSPPFQRPSTSHTQDRQCSPQQPQQSPRSQPPNWFGRGPVQPTRVDVRSPSLSQHCNANVGYVNAMPCPLQIPSVAASLQHIAARTGTF